MYVIKTHKLPTKGQAIADILCLDLLINWVLCLWAFVLLNLLSVKSWGFRSYVVCIVICIRPEQ